MAYVTKVAKQGNSLGVRIPAEILRKLDLSLGDTVSLSLEGQRIEISRADDAYGQAMDLGRQCATRYRRALAKLAK